MSTAHILLYVTTFLSLIFASMRVLRRRTYLPGPPGLPLLGNIFSMPSVRPWETFQHWADTYGDAVFIRVVGQPILILNSYQACNDLLDARPSIYSSRPPSIMVNRMMEWTQAVTTLSYGNLWKQQRRAIALFTRKGVVRECYPLQEAATQEFVSSLSNEPQNQHENLRLTMGRALLESMYGVRDRSWVNRLLDVAEETVQMVTNAFIPGAYFVEFIPALQYVPDWFPGTSWKKVAKRGRRLKHHMVETSFQETRAYMARGDLAYTSSCLVGHLLQEEIPEDIVKWTAGVMHGAGIDTTLGYLLSFLRVMSQHPELQRRAQQELESVVGSDRSPCSDDKPKLPYVNALIKETLRWSPPAPFGIPRMTTEDDTYRGCLVPGGTIVMPNFWAISRDPKIYPNADQFDPTRFMSAAPATAQPKTNVDTDGEPKIQEIAQLNPEKYVFGIGRRSCAGRSFAENIIFLYAASILHAFTIRFPTDGYGNEIQPSDKVTPGAVPLPDPFEYVFVPRRGNAAAAAAV